MLSQSPVAPPSPPPTRLPLLHHMGIVDLAHFFPPLCNLFFPLLIYFCTFAHFYCIRLCAILPCNIWVPMYSPVVEPASSARLQPCPCSIAHPAVPRMNAVLVSCTTPPVVTFAQCCCCCCFCHDSLHIIIASLPSLQTRLLG